MLHTSKIIFTMGAYLDKWPHDVKYVWSFFMFVTKVRKKCHKKLIFTCLMKAFKSNKDHGHIPIFFFMSTIHVKEALIISSYIWHLALKGKMKDVVMVGVTFNPKALVGLYDPVVGVIPTTLVFFFLGMEVTKLPNHNIRLIKISNNIIFQGHYLVFGLVWLKCKNAFLVGNWVSFC